MAKQGGGKLANSLGSFFGVTRYGSETEELSEGMQDVHSHDSMRHLFLLLKLPLHHLEPG